MMDENGKPAPTGLFSRIGVRYEVASEVIGALIAHYAAILGREMEQGEPDESLIRQVGEIDASLDRIRDGLDPRDGAQIEETLSRLAPLARQCYGFPLKTVRTPEARAEDFAQANASLALEGLHVDGLDLAIQARVIRGEISFDEAVSLLGALRRLEAN